MEIASAKTQKQAEFWQKRDQFRWDAIDLRVSQKKCSVRLPHLPPSSFTKEETLLQRAITRKLSDCDA